MPDLRPAALALAAVVAVAVARPELAVAGGARLRVPRMATKARASLRQASFRGSVGIRQGLVGVGGVGGDTELVIRSKQEAQAKGVKRVAGVLSVGPSTAVGTGRVHVTHDRRLIPKLVSWSYSVGPRSKRSPTQGDGIGVPTFNPFIGVTVSRMGGFGIKIAGWPTPLGGWPFTYGTVNVAVNHPSLARPASAVLDRADRLERWLGRVTAPVRRPIAAAARRAVRPVLRLLVAAGDRTRRPRESTGARPGTRRVKVDRAAVIGEGATSIVYATRDGKHVVKQVKPVIKGVQPLTREGRVALAHRTVGGMDVLRAAGLPIPPAWIERGRPDAIVQERVTEGLTISDLSRTARLRARVGILGLNLRAARELWPRRTFGWIDAGSSNVRFDAAGRVVTWFDPVSPIKHRWWRLRHANERRPWYHLVTSLGRLTGDPRRISSLLIGHWGKPSSLLAPRSARVSPFGLGHDVTRPYWGREDL